jgi:hypothetical protein
MASVQRMEGKGFEPSIRQTPETVCRPLQALRCCRPEGLFKPAPADTLRALGTGQDARTSRDRTPSTPLVVQTAGRRAGSCFAHHGHVGGGVVGARLSGLVGGRVRRRVERGLNVLLVLVVGLPACYELFRLVS